MGFSPQSIRGRVLAISGPGQGPGLATDTVNDPVGDAFYSANGARTAATPNLDLKAQP